MGASLGTFLPLSFSNCVHVYPYESQCWPVRRNGTTPATAGSGFHNLVYAFGIELCFVGRLRDCLE
jgi:hypothetical protein